MTDLYYAFRVLWIFFHGTLVCISRLLLWTVMTLTARLQIYRGRRNSR